MNLMHYLPFGSPMGVLGVAMCLMFGCDDFTCADYATCEPAEAEREGGSGQADDAGTSETSANSATSASETHATATFEQTTQPAESSTSGLDDSGLGATGGATSDQDSGVLLATDSGTSNGETPKIDASTETSPDSAAADQQTDDEHSTAEFTDGGDQSQGSTGASTDTNPPDASATQTEADAGTVVDAPRCDPDAPFGRPFAIASVNLANVAENVAMSQDGLNLYVRYGSDSTMYVASREDVGSDFGTPRSFTALDDILGENTELNLKALSNDGLTAYLSDDLSSLRSATRTQLADSFGGLLAHEELSIGGLALVSPWLAAGDTRVYGFVLAYYTLVFSDGNALGFDEITQVDIDGLGSSIYSSILLPSETVVYSTVNQVGEQDTAGLSGIARGKRDSRSDAFDAWEYIEVLDGPGWDTPIWVSADDCELVLTQNADAEAGLGSDPSSDVFISRRAL